MEFIIDKQTIDDLELTGKAKGEKSVFSLFCHTQTKGGRDCLERMFSSPLPDIESIEERMSNIQYFRQHNLNINLNREILDFVEHYLRQGNNPVNFSVVGSYINKWLSKKEDNEKYVIQRGAFFIVLIITDLYKCLKELTDDEHCEFTHRSKNFVIPLIENSELKIILEYEGRKKLYHHEYSRLDYCFRNIEPNNIKRMLDIIYEIDAYRSISAGAAQNGFAMPVFTREQGYFQVRGIFHPFLENPVANDFEFSRDKNICFLTGPNMAGKSTFLKSISIALYLAHLGFPVPAKQMKTSLYNGLLTTINLSDNTVKGYSHFYNEVLRIRHVAEHIGQNSNIFVVFDELFRGTNVKDAYEASLSVIKAFSKLNKGTFAISTHIIEIADKLHGDNSVFFKHFEANMINETPQYNYKIKDGVTDERIGMYILKKEKIIEMIEKAIEK